MGVSVYYVHMGNQTSVILEASQHFCPFGKWKYLIWILTGLRFCAIAERWSAKRITDLQTIRLSEMVIKYLCCNSSQINLARAIFFYQTDAVNVYWQKKKNHTVNIRWAAEMNERKTENGKLKDCPLKLISQWGSPLNKLYQDVKGRLKPRFLPALCFKGDTKEKRATKNLMKWLMPWHAPTGAAGGQPEAATCPRLTSPSGPRWSANHSARVIILRNAKPRTAPVVPTGSNNAVEVK